MKRKFTILLTSLVVCISGALCISAYPQTSGLTPVQLMAMIAGGAFPENLSQDLESRGISFEPDDNFISLANAAGATPTVISALRNAKRNSPPSSGTLASATPAAWSVPVTLRLSQEISAIPVKSRCEIRGRFRYRRDPDPGSPFRRSRSNLRTDFAGQSGFPRDSQQAQSCLDGKR